MANYKNPTTITSESLAPASSINLPIQEPDNTNYQGIIGGGLEIANKFF